MIIQNSSMVPIYEQIISQIKEDILRGKLEEDSLLPSVRGLSSELKISALTVKKAYDILEEEGLVVTVHGKGTFVKVCNKELIKEEARRVIEEDFVKLIEKARLRGLSEDEIKEIFAIMME